MGIATAKVMKQKMVWIRILVGMTTAKALQQQQYPLNGKENNGSMRRVWKRDIEH